MNLRLQCVASGCILVKQAVRLLAL